MWRGQRDIELYGSGIYKKVLGWRYTIWSPWHVDSISVKEQMSSSTESTQGEKALGLILRFLHNLEMKKMSARILRRSH